MCLMATKYQLVRSHMVLGNPEADILQRKTLSCLGIPGLTPALIS